METLFIGRNIIFLSQVDSTNSYAIEMLKNVNLTEGTIIHTHDQTKGRGQRGNTWISEEASNLTMSLIIKPTFLALKNQHYLYKISAIACYDVLTEFIDRSQFDIKIKWPNDILVNKQKISGILIENTINHNHIGYSVIGVGVNVNQIKFNEINSVTSLKNILNKDVSIDRVLQWFCYYFEKYYLQLRSNNLKLINEKYLEHFFCLDTWCDFEIDNQKKNMLVLGLNDNGLLTLQDRNGKQYHLDIKEVKWIF